MHKIGPVAIAVIICITSILFIASKPEASYILTNPVQASIQFTALLGMTFLCMTFVLSLKANVIEAAFGGLDRMFRIHRIVAAAAFLFLTYHPILLIVSSIPNMKLVSLYIVPGLNTPYTFGIISYGILIVLMIATLYLDLPYHIWKFLHGYMGFALLVGGAHSLLVTSDMSRYVPLQVWMSFLIGVGVIAWAYGKLWAYVVEQRSYTIAAKTRVGDTLVLHLSPIMSPLHVTPGQFIYIQIHSDRISSEPHPFSIVDIYPDGSLDVGVKILGDWTLKLVDIPEHAIVTVRGPFGFFAERFLNDTHPAVCIAGGIGITPMYCMIQNEMRRTEHPRKVNLVYSVKNMSDALFHDTFTALAQGSSWFTYTLHQSSISGRLKVDGIQSLLGDEFPKARVFLCGPPGMMHGIATKLNDKGIKKKQIVFEDFSFI
jgi:predicted ferric reductase